MVHKVNNARIVQKLEKRYQLTNIDNSPLLLNDNIQPVTNADALLRKLSYTETGSIDLTNTGYKTMATVPSNKKWYIKSIYCFVASGTTARINTFAVKISPATTDVGFYNTTAATTMYYFLPQELVLQPGDILSVNVSTGNAGDLGTARILYEEEDYYG